MHGGIYIYIYIYRNCSWKPNPHSRRAQWRYISAYNMYNTTCHMLVQGCVLAITSTSQTRLSSKELRHGGTILNLLRQFRVIFSLIGFDYENILHYTALHTHEQYKFTLHCASHVLKHSRLN